LMRSPKTTTQRIGRRSRHRQKQHHYREETAFGCITDGETNATLRRGDTWKL
jgi:Tfp pilus assembly protein PilV